MTITSRILLLLWFIQTSFTLEARVGMEPFEDELPSQQIEQELASISQPSVSLRQAPDEDGWAQKEVPLSGIDFGVLLFLGVGILLYSLVKTNTKRKRLFLTSASLLLMGVQLNAQGTFQANPDNAFIEPNTSSWVAIDVLYNDYYVLNQTDDCTRGGLEIELWDTSTSSFTTSVVNGALGRARVAADNQIEYRPLANKKGQDKITYQIYCPKSNKRSQADIYINVNDKPDAISDADCYVDPVGITFHMKEQARSPLNNVSTYATPLVGDVDNDGNVEMFALSTPVGSGIGIAYQVIRAFRYNGTSTLTELPNYSITLPINPINPYASGYTSAPFVIAKVDGKEKASIFALSGSLLLRYDINALGKYVETARATIVGGNEKFTYASPVVVDIMGAGRTQVCVLDEVYDTKSLKLIAKGNFIPSTGSTSSYSFGRFGATNQNFESALVPGDIDNDGILELVGGDCVYKVNIVNFDNKVLGNTFTLFKRANKTGHPNIGDGATALIDIDLDGKLEVAVSGPKAGNYAGDKCIVYVYNPRTGIVLHSNNPEFTRFKKNQGPSRIFAGDIDGDGFPEICMTSYNILLAFQMDNDAGSKTTTLNTKWSYVIDDESSSTTLSMFDFTQEGKARLVYRDQTHLRIIDGSGSSAIQEAGSFTPIGSGTANEFPTVADVNGDGAAEIIVTGNLDGAYNNVGHLRVFGADISKGKLWAPARKVWNQATYNPLYVNDDLTIPKNPIHPSTAFVSLDGHIERPFNNLLQQSTSLNKEGTMIMLGPDLIFDPRVPKRLIYNTSGGLDINVGILNQGDAVFSGPISLQLYAYVQATDIYVPVGIPFSYPNTLGLPNKAPNNTATINYTIPNISTALPGSFDNLVMTVNLNSNPKYTPTFSGSTECLEGRNNFASGFSLVNGDRVMCEGSIETVQLEGVGTYTVKWFTSSSGGVPIYTGASMPVQKNIDPVTHYFVECYATPTSSTPITSIRDTVFVYLAPDTLVWTGGGNTSDWHDWQNWKDPTETLALKACLPRACTNVLLPTNINIYPNLDVNETAYAKYIAGECNNIHFAHGGELVRPDMLTYSKAFVDVTFQSHRWHLFAPPLKDFYTGDIYINDIIPVNDIVKSWTKFWGRREPWTNSYRQEWNRIFHQPDETFVAGQGLGVWIDDKSVSGMTTPPRDPFSFSFPKNDPEYNIYIVDTNTPANDPKNPYQTPRADNYRFIFDGTTAGNDFSLKIDSENPQAGDVVLIGNPFMAHLDFDEFYLANSTLIHDYYMILDENMAQQHYNKGGSSSLTKDIAPMQAFLVELKGAATNLTANGTMTLSVPGDKLRSSSADNVESFHLKVTASQGDMESSTYIGFSDEAQDRYQAGEDIAGIYPAKASADTRSIMLYSQTANGMKTSLNTLNTGSLHSKEVPLGFWSPQKSETNQLMLNVSNLNLLPIGYTVYLHDKQTNQSYDLSLNSMHTFDGIRAGGDQFVDNRFSLKFAYASSKIEDEESDRDLVIVSDQGILRIESTSVIDAVQIFTLQGGLVLDTKLHTDRFETILPRGDLYLIKVRQGDRDYIRKIFSGN